MYNALKTLRWKGVHDAIWRDDKVKNVHFILSPKPWDETQESLADAPVAPRDESHEWWWEINNERLKHEKTQMGLDDGF